MGDMKKSVIIGRDDCIKTFREATKNPTEYLPIEITGESGTGKTYLIRYLKEMTISTKYPCVLLDFEQGNLRTDALAISFHLLYSLRLYLDLQKWNDFKKILIDEQKNLARLPLQLTINQFIPATHSTVTNVEQSVQASKLIRKAEEQAINVVTQTLLDVLVHISKMPLIILLDSLDRINDLDNKTLMNWLFYSVIIPLVEMLQGNVVIVAAGQPPLSLEKYLPDISKITLKYFSEEQTIKFLGEKVKIFDQELQSNIYKTTKGHPMLTDIIVNVWAKETKSGQIALPFHDLKGEFEEVARTEWVMNRVVERLDKSLGEIVRYGVILRSFNYDALQRIFPNLLDKNVKVFEKLISYPFISRLNKDSYVFHELIRTVQADFLRRQLNQDWELLHKRALDYYIDQIDKAHNETYKKLCIANRIFHQLVLSEEVGIEEWNSEFNNSLLAWDRVCLVNLLSVVNDPTLNLSEISKGFVLLNQGKLHVQDAKWDVAKERYQESLILFNNLDDKLGQAEAHKGLGNIYYSRGEFSVALLEYSYANDLYQSINNEDGLARTSKSIGDIYLKQGSYDQALVSYRKAKSLFIKLNNKIGEASCLYGAADVDYTQANYESAIMNYEDALCIYKEINANFESANVHRSIGEVRIRQGKFSAAKGLFEKARKIYKSLGAISGVALTDRGIGDILIKQGKFEDAKTYYEKSIEVFQEANLGMEYATSLLRLGDYHYRDEDYPSAIVIYNKVLILYNRLGGKMGEANVNLRLGKSYLRMGEIDSALNYFQESFQKYSQLGGKLGVANSLFGFADTFFVMQNYDKAGDNYQSALNIFTELKTEAGIANCYFGKAEVFRCKDNFENATELYLLALGLFKKLGFANEAELVQLRLRNL